MPSKTRIWWALPNATPLNAGNPRTRVAPLPILKYVQQSNRIPIDVLLLDVGWVLQSLNPTYIFLPLFVCYVSS
ncbi:hypothetical protein Cal7507_4131 [Calothrix sp. PCC 7507]|nr:hypothetical protein Cal7507_4131 [Calothrix sp. PCC 7507]